MEHASISRPKLRQLLHRLFATPSELDAFVLDYFPAVYRSLGAGMDAVAKVNVLMERVEPDEILARIEEHQALIASPEEAFPSVMPAFSADEGLSAELYAGVQDDAGREEATSRDASAVLVLCAPADIESFARLRVHLSALERSGMIAVSSDRDIAPGEAWAESLNRLVDGADLIMPLLSPDFLASNLMEVELPRAMRRYKTGEITLLPVMLRPALLESTVLADLQILPRDGTPLLARRDQDEAWVEVVRELRAAVQYRARPPVVPPPAPAARPPLRGGAAPLSPPVRTGSPRAIVQIGDIFRTTGTPDSTFVEPQQLTQLTVYLNTMGQGLVVEGPSGVGKTTAVRRSLQSTVRRHAEHWIRSKEQSERAALDGALDAGFEGHLIVDDFHYLDPPRQRRLADVIKSLADQERKDAKITVIGVNPVGVSLTQGFPDLVGRFKTVAMRRQPDEKIAELIRKGEAAANVSFLRRDEYIREARGSFHTAQLLCFYACLREGVVQTLARRRSVTSELADLRRDIIDELRAKYHDRLAALATLDEVSPPRGACLSLLWLLSQERFDYVSIDDASNQLPELAPAFAWLKSGHLSDHFSRHPELSTLLHYSQSASVLSAEDPQLEFYLRNLSWREFAAMTGHRSVRIESDGQLRFAAPPAPPRITTSPAPASPLAAPPEAPAARPQPQPLSSGQTATAVPESLRAALRSGHVIPFVGAGVSMSVMDAARPGARLFPSWAALLEKAADRLDAEGAAGDAMAVRGALRKSRPNYLEAARNAREGLGPLWYDVLRRALDPPSSRADRDSLALPRAVWGLGSKLIVTTNYDRVLHWTCPDLGNLRYWDIEAPAELVQLLRDGVDYPTIWHLHGYIANAADLILTPDGYSRLYPTSDAEGTVFKAALTSLRMLIASRTFLFIGFSFDDASFGDELRWVHDTFAGAAGPHYVLSREADAARARSQLRGLPMEVMTYPEHGAPLVSLLGALPG